MQLSDYDSLPGIRWSRLKLIGKSPKHYKYEVEHGSEDTGARRLGRVAHTALYEPHLLEARYFAYGGAHDKRHKAFQKVLEENPGKEIIKPDALAKALAMAAAVLNDEAAGPIVKGAFVEQVLTWEDPRTGAPCKCRIDQVNGRLADAKTTSSILPRLFRNDVEKYGYLGQLAFYSDGLQANGIPVSDLPAIIAIENGPPHDVIVYEIGEDDLDAGRAMYQQYLDTLLECQRTNIWPGIAGGKLQRFVRAAWAREEAQEPDLTWKGVPLDI